MHDNFLNYICLEEGPQPKAQELGESWDQAPPGGSIQKLLELLFG